MKFILELIIVVATLVVAGRQPSNKLGSVLGVVLVGIMLFSCVVQLPDRESKTSSNRYSYSSSYSSQSGSKSSIIAPNYKKALTKEEANALRGTGYKGTRPNSSAESHELNAAQVKCKECGYHSDNGYNSLCDYCQSKNRK